MLIITDNYSNNLSKPTKFHKVLVVLCRRVAEHVLLYAKLVLTGCTKRPDKKKKKTRFDPPVLEKRRVDRKAKHTPCAAERDSWSRRLFEDLMTSYKKWYWLAC